MRRALRHFRAWVSYPLWLRRIKPRSLPAHRRS